MQILDQVSAAFDRQDYQLAAQLLKEVLKESPQNPWVQLYLGRLHEASGKLATAEKVYRGLLKDTSNPKIAVQARQGIQRVEELVQEQRKQALAQATATPEAVEQGVLILEAVEEGAKKSAAQTLAQVLHLDLYTARLQLPHRGWRVYRTGAIGELQFYGEQLRQAGVPTFWAAMPAVQQLPVFQVQYFQQHQPKAVAVCQNAEGQLGSLTFDWAEVGQQVEGRVPIFEQVVDTDLRQGIQRQRKSQTQDYALLCDLHLPGRGCILRICDLNYQFDQGIAFSAPPIEPGAIDHSTSRLNWNHLRDFLKFYLPQQPVWSDFTAFADSAIAQALLLKRIHPHLRLFGQEANEWYPAFQLYSALAFIRHTNPYTNP